MEFSLFFMTLSLFIIWLAIAAYFSHQILIRIFHLGWLNYALGAFLPIFILAPMSNIFTAWLVLNNYTIGLALVLTSMVIGGIYFFLRDWPVRYSQLDESGAKNLPSVVWAVFILLLAVGWIAIFYAASGSHLTSPWQVLPAWLFFIIVLASAVIFYAIFSGQKIQRVLIATIIFSLFIHSYLLVYANGFGGDRFRHLGSEQRIMQELEYQPTLLTKDVWLKQIGPVKIPQALIDSAKLSYGAMWSLEIIAAKITGISIFQINRFFMPLLWSLFLPLIVFVLCWLVWPDKKFALLGAMISNGLYLFQYYGAQGLPASYGLLWLAFFLIFLIAWLQGGGRRLLAITLFFLVLMYFNYLLSFILAVLSFLLVLGLKLKKIYFWLALPLVIAVLVTLDYFFSPQFAPSLVRLVNTWVAGNFIYFVSSARLANWIGEWHIFVDFVFVLVFISSMIYLLFRVFKKNTAWQFMAGFLVMIMAAYFISWPIFGGEHSISRRLTLFAALPLVFLIAYAFMKTAVSGRGHIAAVAILALFTAFNWYSGPILNISISDRDLARAQAIWTDYQKLPTSIQDKYCVKDDLSVILALEYFSGKEFQETINNQKCLVIK